MYYVYVLLSLRDKNKYIGFTNDLDKRIADHKKGKVAATRFRKPLRLIYFEGGLSKKKAIRIEKYFKTGFGRRFLNKRI